MRGLLEYIPRDTKIEFQTLMGVVDFFVATNPNWKAAAIKFVIIYYLTLKI